MTWMSTFAIVARLAVGSLIASRWKTLTVGAIIAFGASLVVVGHSILETVGHSVGSSVTDSIVGDIQVYSQESKGALELMGGTGDSAGLEPLADFAEVSSLLLGLPNVAEVVPMGSSFAFAYSGTSIDKALADLRAVWTKRAQSAASAELDHVYAAKKSRVHHVLSVFGDMSGTHRIAEESAGERDQKSELVRRAQSAEFWRDFDRDPEQHLEFLENRVAPLTGDGDFLYLPCLGTDLQAFAAAFPRLQIVDGGPIPAGERGFLFSKQTYETQVKLKAARGFDRLKLALDELRQTIAGEPELQRLVRSNVASVGGLLLQLDEDRTRWLHQALQRFMKSDQPDVARLLASFFDVDDTNFHARYAFFTRELAPHMELYRIRVGDSLTLTSSSRGGYVRSASLKVYGTFEFKGLERSPEAGFYGLMDLVSFRELYGFVTPETTQEIATLRAAANVQEVARADVEAMLFGASEREERLRQLVQSAPRAAEPRPKSDAWHFSARRRADEPYDPAQLRQGTFLSAAIRVQDPSRIEQTLSAIEQAGRRASLPLKAVPWQAAAGVFGQFVTVTGWVLYAAMLVLFSVAMLVINNALLLATLQRVSEIGVLRAIGAQRGVILGMLLCESFGLGLLSAIVGASFGAVAVVLLGRLGIAATSDATMFFFSGPRLHPVLSSADVALSVLSLTLVSVIGGIYPAWLALRISPREAMGAEE